MVTTNPDPDEEVSVSGAVPPVTVVTVTGVRFWPAVTAPAYVIAPFTAPWKDGAGFTIKFTVWVTLTLLLAVKITGNTAVPAAVVMVRPPKMTLPPLLPPVFEKLNPLVISPVGFGLGVLNFQVYGGTPPPAVNA
jgi:hypothetical protein